MQGNGNAMTTFAYFAQTTAKLLPVPFLLDFVVRGR